jgi:hypothetical protein
METHKIIVKYFAQESSRVRGEEFVPVFHSWIQGQLAKDHLLIDVADYQHVHHGPGTVLVAHEANFSMDKEDGKLGLMYVRKQPAAGDFAARLKQAFAATLEGCARLETQFDGRLKFRTDQVVVRLNDRLLAPNTTATFETVSSPLRNLIDELYPSGDAHLEHIKHPQRLFEVQIRTAENPPVASLIQRLG